MKYCSANGNMSDVFNVCTGIETNIIDLAEEIAVLLRQRPVINYGPPRPGDPRRSIGCPDKAHHVLGFRAVTTLMSGLERTLREEASGSKTLCSELTGPTAQASTAQV
jgi:nucleoside-diphosphate-sugar epimerase